MTREPSEIVAQRRALGDRLAAFRHGANLTQGELARRVHRDRTSVVHIEKGRRSGDESFWQAVDQAVGAHGVLLSAFHGFESARRLAEHRRQSAELARAQAQLARWREDDPAGAEPDDVATSLEFETAATRGQRPPATTVDQIEELLAHLRQQWHLLVRTDNLFGPRFALGGVLLQLQLLDELLVSARAAARVEFVKLAARYAESAAWLYEDSGDLATAQAYNSRAMAWAQEAGDDCLVAWTLFRRSQQAAYRGDAAQVIGLSQAAQRHEAVLTTPMRAAIAQQEAHGYAIDGDEAEAQRLLDESHRWAATDTAGDAREGHGSFCTDSYIELQRAACYLRLGQPQRAIQLYENTLPTLPTVYRRDRGIGLSRCAIAHLVAGRLEQAAEAAHDALQIAVDVGSQRTLRQVQAVGRRLTAHRGLKPIDLLLDELALLTTS